MREIAVKEQISQANVSNFANKIIPLRDRAKVQNKWLKFRLNNVLPMLMKRAKLDMWLITAREYNEDPVMMSLLPAEQFSARRRTILVFYLQEDDTVECLTLSRPVPVIEQFYKAAWTDNKVDQYTRLAEIITERDPKTIGINVNHDFSFGDGLAHGEYINLVEALPDKYLERLKCSIELCVGWLEYRTEQEIMAYSGINEIAHSIIAEAFSSRVVLPSVTTALDVAWWIRQRICNLGLKTWFMPSVSIQRQGKKSVAKDEVILAGDILHCDVGIKYLGLCTDTQQHAYVLKLGETDTPEGLKQALACANMLQDIHAKEMILGKAGNQILQAIREKAIQAGLEPCVYSHPIGYHGHGAGPTIGLYDHQEGVIGRGD